ncbi:MAG: endolytic transglycosylase MltG [Bacteroidales bacterium]|nr:endolytic transglycosylase MltG [Bacteroidales bacterium]
MKRASSRLLMLCFLAVAIYIASWLFTSFIKSPCNIEKTVSVYVYPGDNQEKVLKQLIEVGQIKHPARLVWLLNILHYSDNVHVGRYDITPGMSAYRIAKNLRSGLQTPVKLTFNNMRTMADLTGRLSKQLMSDSVVLMKTFEEKAWKDSMKLTPQNYMCVFIPNTYEVYWNITPEKLLELFQREYDKFWNDTRKAEAEKIGLTPVEVSTLAAIVEEETNKSDEMPKVAGLYLNRLKIDMPLQADPTVKFAVGDFTIKRILREHTRISSPYNTYKNTGLPPGPIRIPSIRAIDAVLNPVKHSYIYMCAKDDFSGYHAFATTLSQHNDNASAYHRALNKHGF